ncbi:hypothetical protein [uncultured Nevskia sp.]|uniref:hypothetical protein n=1 Tax=uncultured Nevskia sp. TaxID=228950 RepID=UPI0025F1560F|nr:hypothetical protein [uncultured Nevskia sp.]
MKVRTLIATTVLLLSATQLHAQSPGDGKPTGGVGTGTANGKVDGSPTPGGPDEKSNMKLKKNKRSGTEGTQSGAKPGTPMATPAEEPGTAGKPTTPGSSNTQSGKKTGEPDSTHDYGPGKTDTPTPR